MVSIQDMSKERAGSPPQSCPELAHLRSRTPSPSAITQEMSRRQGLAHDRYSCDQCAAGLYEKKSIIDEDDAFQGARGNEQESMGQPEDGHAIPLIEIPHTPRSLPVPSLDPRYPSPAPIPPRNGTPYPHPLVPHRLRVHQDPADKYPKPISRKEQKPALGRCTPLLWRETSFPPRADSLVEPRGRSSSAGVAIPSASPCPTAPTERQSWHSACSVSSSLRASGGDRRESFDTATSGKTPGSSRNEHSSGDIFQSSLLGCYGQGILGLPSTLGYRGTVSSSPALTNQTSFTATPSLFQDSGFSYGSDVESKCLAVPTTLARVKAGEVKMVDSGLHHHDNPLHRWDPTCPTCQKQTTRKPINRAPKADATHSASSSDSSIPLLLRDSPPPTQRHRNRGSYFPQDPSSSASASPDPSLPLGQTHQDPNFLSTDSALSLASADLRRPIACVLSDSNLPYHSSGASTPQSYASSRESRFRERLSIDGPALWSATMGHERGDAVQEKKKKECWLKKGCGKIGKRIFRRVACEKERTA